MERAELRAYLRDKPLLCRLGLHKWTVWGHNQDRWYRPSQEGEGTIYYLFWQMRRCMKCGLWHREDVETEPTGLTVSQAINYGILHASERAGLGSAEKLPVLEVDSPEDIPASPLCRMGLHRDIGAVPQEYDTGHRICGACWSARVR
jgi:hypothetical protein